MWAQEQPVLQWDRLSCQLLQVQSPECRRFLMNYKGRGEVPSCGPQIQVLGHPGQQGMTWGWQDRAQGRESMWMDPPTGAMGSSQPQGSAPPRQGHRVLGTHESTQAERALNAAERHRLWETPGMMWDHAAQAKRENRTPEASVWTATSAVEARGPHLSVRFVTMIINKDEKFFITELSLSANESKWRTSYYWTETRNITGAAWVFIWFQGKDCLCWTYFKKQCEPKIKLNLITSPELLVQLPGTWRTRVWKWSRRAGL